MAVHVVPSVLLCGGIYQRVATHDSDATISMTLMLLCSCAMPGPVEHAEILLHACVHICVCVCVLLPCVHAVHGRTPS